MVEGSNTINQNKKVAWVKILNSVTKGIKIIAKYFKDYPIKESLFKRKTLEMLGLKSSITGNDSRELKKKDNTVLWILGIIGVSVAGYFIYRYFDKQKEARLKAESLDRMNKLNNGGFIEIPLQQQVPTQVQQVQMPPAPIDPAYIVPTDVLIPEQQMMQPLQTMQQPIVQQPIVQTQPMQMIQPNQFNNKII